MAEVLTFITFALVGLEKEEGQSNWTTIDNEEAESDEEETLRGRNDVYEYIGKSTANVTTISNGLSDARAWARQKNRAAEGSTGAEELMEEIKNLIEEGSRVVTKFLLRRTLKTRNL